MDSYATKAPKWFPLRRNCYNYMYVHTCTCTSTLSNLLYAKQHATYRVTNIGFGSERIHLIQASRDWKEDGGCWDARMECHS